MKIPRNTKTLLFTYWVYKDLEVAVGTSDTINVILEEDSVASPWWGFTRMKEYVQENLRYPEAAKKAKIEGSVEVEFAVDGVFPKGVHGFRVVKSLGYGCDEEAIRLLEEGSSWEPRNYETHREIVRYTIEFKLK